jgi:anhydro-N-acetylmuramic acid kinase
MKKGKESPSISYFSSLNFYSNQLGFDYDDKEKISTTGLINNSLLNELNNLDFYQQTHPKIAWF